MVHVDGPHPVPAGDEGLVDIQVSVSNSNWPKPNPRGMDLICSLQGMKHRQGYVYDDGIPSDLIVLWFGPKSPNNFTPDDRIAAYIHPRPGESHTCEFVAQVPGFCPFPPQ